MTAVSTKMIKSACRVLEVLEYFDQDLPTATVMDIARSLGYPQSSTSELLRCLVTLGYLRYDRHSRTYNPTARVALIGAWVEPNLFREGVLLPTIDTIAAKCGHTVVLSTAANYLVQHIHAVHGSASDRVAVRVGGTEALLHSARGRLLLSTYTQPQIRSAIHRLNAEESSPDRLVRLSETLLELAALRGKGWVADIGPDGGTGVVAVMLPPRQGGQRIALSIAAPSAVIEARSDEFRQIIEASGLWSPPQARASTAHPADPRSTPMPQGGSTRSGDETGSEFDVRRTDRPPLSQAPNRAVAQPFAPGGSTDRARRNGGFPTAVTTRATGRYLALT